MRRFSGSYPATGDSFWSGLDEGDDLPIEPRGPTNWRLVAAIVVYGALVFLVGLLLAN